MKKILLITYHFPPVGGSGVVRTLKFAKYLPVYDWEPYILTIKESDYESYMPKDNCLLNEISSQMKITRTSVFRLLNYFIKIREGFRKYTLSDRKSNLHQNDINGGHKGLIQKFKDIFTGAFTTPDNQIGWLPFGIYAGVKLIEENNIDIIYSSGPPWTTHLIGYLLKKITKRKWIVDFRDPWTQDLLYVEKEYTTIRKRIERFLEKKILYLGDRIICISQTMRINLVNKYPRIKEKTTIITNGFDEDDFRADASVYNLGQSFIISHIGTLYHKRNPENFLRAIAKMINSSVEIKKRLKVRFIGIIEDREEYVRLIAKYGLNEVVETINYVSRQEALKYLLTSTALLLLIGSQKSSQYILTGKIFEYLGSGKPILALVPEGGEAANLIKMTNSGIVVNPDCVEEIKTAVQKLYSMHLDGQSSTTFAKNDISSFSRKKITGDLARLLNASLEE